MNLNFVQEIKAKYNLVAKTVSLQLLQTIAIGSFLLTGGVFLGYINIAWWEVIMVLVVVGGLDYYLRTTIDGKAGFPFSAINSGIGICLFLRTEWWPILFFAALVAIASKYLIRSGPKHFFNPSYTAIFLMIALFGNEAYVNHFQWGFDWLVLLPILCLGLFVTIRAGLWDSVLV
jgi:Na+-transporting NADH:ubiquinone oxidoreductase subunit NqrB